MMTFFGLVGFFTANAPRPAGLRLFATVPGLAGALLLPATLAGQAQVRDLVISGGIAGEAWRGDFTALSFPQIDSTERAVALVGEWSANGIFTLFRREHNRLETTVDVGIRQFATGGFQLRNYAPREHGGFLTTNYWHEIGGGRLGTVFGEVEAQFRQIVDRPPMPLYLSPGYEIYRVKTGYRRSVRAATLDLTVTGEEADYAAPAGLPNLDLLDRSSVMVEVGRGRRFQRHPDSERYSGFRVFGAFRYHSYPKQGAPELRVDRAAGLGGTYELGREQLEFKATLQGTRSRSTSRRVEYNAARLDVELQLWELWKDMDLNIAGTLARKRYIDPGQDALVPGEEADNETSLYAELTRSLGLNVDGAFRAGWHKVETNFSGAYYTRFGGAFFLRVRPW